MAIMNSDERLANTYMNKEEFESYDNRIRSSLNNVVNTINANQNANVDWQKKTLIVGFILSLVFILSIATSIIVSYLYMNEINTNLNTLIQLTEQYSTEITKLNTQIDKLEIVTSDIQQIDEVIEETEENVEEIITEIETPTIEYNTTNITQKSGFTAEQFNTIIDTVLTNLNKGSTKMTGIGEALYQVEQEYDVNGLYLLGIASLESGWGTSQYATERNNIYGLINKTFDSVDECTLYMGKLIRNSYIDQGYDTLSKIQTKYCPSGGSKWINDITICTNRYITAATELYIQQ